MVPAGKSRKEPMVMAWSELRVNVSRSRVLRRCNISYLLERVFTSSAFLLFSMACEASDSEKF